MKNPWFRLYAEFATDPKVQSMSETFQRRLVMLFCLQCSGDLKGLGEDELACALRISPSELQRTKNVFEKKEFLVNGWELRNWDKRQFISDDVTKRVQRFREKQKKNETFQKRCGNGDETEMKQPQITDTDTDTDTDTEDNFSNEKSLVVAETKPGPPDLSEEKELLLSRYVGIDREVVANTMKAIAITRKSGKVSENVLLAELRRWNSLAVERVMYGMGVYLDKEYHLDHKSESYLWAIMKNATQREIENRRNTNGHGQSTTPSHSRQGDGPSQGPPGKYSHLGETIDLDRED